MMGKLSSWRPGQNNHFRGSSLGGLVSIEDLERSQSKSPAAKKKTPGLAFLGLNKPDNSTSTTSFDPWLSSSPPSDIENNGNMNNVANVQAGHRRPSFGSGRRYSLSGRPRTADSQSPPVTAFTRQRSDTAPITTPPELRSDRSWKDPRDKPLPLALDMEPRRNTPQSDGSATRAANTGFDSINQSRTLESVDNTRRNQELLKSQYTLVPSITPPLSRGSNSTSSSAGASSASSRFATTSSSNSRTNSTKSTSTSLETPIVNYPPALRNSILDEVEGTLSATITELQELQIHSIWRQPREQSPQTLQSDSGPVQSIDSYYHQAQKPSWGSTGSNSTSADRVTTPSGALNPHNTRTSLSPPPLNPTKSLPPPDQDEHINSLQAALDEQKSISSTLISENETMRQRLELLQRRLTAFESEKPSLVRAAKDAEANLQLTLSKLREAKVSELAAQKEFSSARNAISILETRCAEEKNRHDTTKEELQGEKEKCGQLAYKLEEVNSQKVDLLEAGIEMRKDVVVTKKKLKKITEELNTVKRRETEQPNDGPNAKLEEAMKKIALLESELSRLQPGSDLPSRVADLTFQLEDAQFRLGEQQALVESLTQRNNDALALVERFEREVRDTRTAQSTSSSSSSPRTIDSDADRENWQLLTRKYEESEAARQSALDERDRALELLRAEVRRIAVDEHGAKHPSMPFLKKRVDVAEAVELVKGRAKAYLKENRAESTAEANSSLGTAEVEATRLREKVNQLEDEIDYYLKDIVLYKLDVKGYKKDLKRAEKKIKEMEQGGVGNGTYTERTTASSPTSPEVFSPVRGIGLNMSSIGDAM